MEKHELTCIVCPVGCRVQVETDGEEMRVSGNQCKRGEQYCRREVARPVRMVTSLVAIEGAARPVCPVRTSAPVPRRKVGEVFDALRAARAKAPVHIGEVLIANVADSGADLIFSAEINALDGGGR